MKNVFIFVALFFSLFFFSCKKKTKLDMEPIIPDVYVSLLSTRVRDYAQYWKNGEIIKLTTPNEYPHARAIFGSGNDMYVVGQGSLRNNLASTIVGQYWKNGIVTYLGSSISGKELLDVVVSEGDLYIAGNGLNNMQNDEATYWKNGKAIPLDEASQRPSKARGIFVAGKDVYVAGTLTRKNDVAVYWKNGAVVNLGDPATTSHANSVAVSGKNVYVAGNENVNYHARARLWKNGIGTFLTDGSEYGSEVTDIALSGNDVYCVGEVLYNDDTNVAIMWKNGVPQILPQGVRATSIFLFNNDVYVAGDGVGFSLYWKNGEPVRVTEGNGSASSIFVKNP